MSDQYTGVERRALNDGNDKLILFRLEAHSEKIKEINDDLKEVKSIVSAMKTEQSVMKNEMTHIAKEAGKTSGTISGIGTGVVMGIIGLVIQGLSK